jgi:hypothetical protein
MFVGMKALQVYKSSLMLALRTGIVCSAGSVTDMFMMEFNRLDRNIHMLDSPVHFYSQ